MHLWLTPTFCFGSFFGITAAKMLPGMPKFPGEDFVNSFYPILFALVLGLILGFRFVFQSINNFRGHCEPLEYYKVFGMCTRGYDMLAITIGAMDPGAVKSHRNGSYGAKSMGIEMGMGMGIESMGEEGNGNFVFF